MEIFGARHWNVVNKNTQTGVVLKTIWNEETRTSKGNIPTNHQKRGPSSNIFRHKTFKEWLETEMDGIDCSLPCVSGTGREGGREKVQAQGGREGESTLVSTYV